ncbi:hypothetical protein [Paenibacillus sp. HJGM_3]|uniref:hypothetical protein n=1 Tax=Paenibacillus sp. HJGM_3 TaxID=3379816 RepID=UPI003860035D
MIRIARILLEIVRVLVIYVLGGWLLWLLENHVYGGNLAFSSIAALFLANTMIILILYRNVFMHTGWYQGENDKKLPKKVTLGMTVVIAVLIGLPLFCENRLIMRRRSL